MVPIIINSPIPMTLQSINSKLLELSKHYETDIQLLINGAKVKRKEESQNVKSLKADLKLVIQHISADGNTTKHDWSLTKTLIIFTLRDTLQAYNAKYKDSQTFADEVDIILQYLVQFDRAPFTIQRICQLIVEPEIYYKSTKKLLYAFEKLVNVCEPDEKV